MRLGVIVQCPSPHQKVLLDSLFRVPDVDLVCAYAFPANPRRTWGVPLADGPTTVVPFQPGLGCYRRLHDWIATAACDVWVLGSVVTAIRTQMLASALKVAGVPWAYLGEPPRPRSGWRRVVRDFLLQRVLNRCDGAIGTGRESAHRYARLLGDGRPVTSVPYFIPLEPWLALPLIDAPPLAGPVRFLTVAQLIPRKGLDILIEACSLLPSEGWTLDVYGEGPERQRLQAMISARSLPITLHRPVPFDRRMEAFDGKHCFVFPSRWDGWGMAPVEALAAGIPVIASDQTMSAHDFVVAGENGWIVPCAAPAFATAMARLLKSRACLPTMSRRARRSVAEYDPNRGAAALVTFCESLIRRRRAAADAQGLQAT
jgi:glycosyltransferase involved in cell wall biosynthesis